MESRQCDGRVTTDDDNDDDKDDDGDSFVPALGPGPSRPQEYHASGDDDVVDGTNDRGVREGNARRREEHDIGDGIGRDDGGEGIARRRRRRRRRGREDDENYDDNVDDNDDTPPAECWMPFSYVLIGKCRRRARVGLTMPLADAEGWLLI